MISSTDLHPILVFYAQKNNSPYIAIDSFLDFLSQTAKHYSTGYPAWKKWLQDKEVKFWSEMNALVQDGKCEIVSEAEESQIFMTGYHPELIYDAYQKADNEADLPFPSEESMRIILPAAKVKFLSSENDFLSALDEGGKSSGQIVKINFP